jgi:ABC-type transport system substrate-binding protein
MASDLFSGRSIALDSYLLPDHPLYNADAKRYPYDPAKGAEMLSAAGWQDLDNEPATPRTAQAVLGVPDGTPFEFTYLSSPGAEKERVAEILQSSLAGCGIKANVEWMEFADLLAPGPEGRVFGRNFDMAGFAWLTTLEPPCSLFTSDEIPGPYPTFSKGWGGANATGFSNFEFDTACGLTSASFSESEEYASAHAQAQALFAEELPVIPLYARIRLVAFRPELCEVIATDPLENVLWNLEMFEEGENCP